MTEKTVKDKMKLCILLICVTECMISIKCYSSTTCLSHRYDTSHICQGRSEPLQCSNGDLIMIKEIHYAKIYKRYRSCDYCSKDIDKKNLDINFRSFQRKVYEMCSQRDKCSLNGMFETPSNLSDHNRYLWLATISYGCVKKGMVYDMCSPFDATLNEDDTLHFSLLGFNITTDNCNCVIDDRTGNSTITIVDYRPYSGDTTCAVYISFYEKRFLRYQCLKSPIGTDANVFNTALNVTSKIIDITVSLHEVNRSMLWFMVKGVDVLVQCNIAYNPLSRSTIVSTSEASAGRTKTTLNPSLTSSPSASRKSFPTSAVIGTIVAFVVFIIVTIATILLCRRKHCSQQTPVISDARAVYYNEGSNNNELQEEHNSEKDVNHFVHQMENSCTDAKRISATDEEIDIDDVYLNEDIDGTQTVIANKGVATSARKRDINETGEYYNQEPHYNALQATTYNHVYTEIDISDRNKNAYYNIT